MKTWRGLSVGVMVVLAIFFNGSIFNLQAQTNSGVRLLPRNGLAQIPVFANNPVALELITDLLAEPEPELSVPEVSQTPSVPGTYWTLKGASAPLPFNPFPDLPVYVISTNCVYLIDDRSVDYAALNQAMQAEAQLAAFTSGTVGAYTIDTNGLSLEVPTNSLSDAGQFKVILHNSMQGQSYDFLTKADLSYPTWATELTVTGAVGNATEVQLPMNSRTNLFVRARISAASSFYVVAPPLSQDVAWGDTVTFSVETAGNTNLTFQWLLNGVPIDGATNRSYTIDCVRGSGTGNSDIGDYSVVISDGTNSVVTPAALLRVNMGCDNFNVPLLSQRQDYKFKSGKTYFIYHRIPLYGNTVIEGGAVIKFPTAPVYQYFGADTNASLVIIGTLTCPTNPYCPAILTSWDDYWQGMPLPLILSWPQTAQNGMAFLDMANAMSSSVSNLRICLADWGITTPVASRRLDVWNCQFIWCNYGVMNLVDGSGATDSLHNVLISACGAAIGAANNAIDVEAEQVTADVDDFCLAATTPNRMALTNSLIWGNSVAASTLSTVNVEFNPDDTNFQTSALGYYYLAANSPLHHAGTTNISPRLQAEFRNKTTYPPVAFPAFMQLSGTVTLGPQAPRDTDGTPDLGYHYDALDYTVAGMYLMNGCSVTILPGTAIGLRMELVPEIGNYNYFGFDSLENSSFVSQGTPAKPNTFVDLQLVQEGPQWPIFASFFMNFWPTEPDSQPPSLDFRFSNFYLGLISIQITMNPYLYGPSYHFCSGTTYWYGEVTYDSAVNLSLRDCQFHGGQIDLGQCDYGFSELETNYPLARGAVKWINNLFDGVGINLDPNLVSYGDPTLYFDLSFQACNNLFRNCNWFRLVPIPATAGNWTLRDNFFDKVTFLQNTNQPLDYDNNGYWPLTSAWLWWYGGYATLNPTTAENDAHDVMLSNAPPYQAGPFGNYYLPDTTPLYGTGSTNAGALGFAQFTTRSDQTKEDKDHTVNIGLHYVAATNLELSTLNYQPLDSDGDGVPDFMEDANGNGYVDVNETDLTNPETAGYADATNSVYDAIDLDGDGLTGLAELFFGTNPLIADNPINLVAVSQSGALSSVIQIPLNIGANVDTNSSFQLVVDGVEANAEVYETNGNWIAEWDTMTIQNGPHLISLRFNYDTDGSRIFGGAQFVAISNALTLDENFTWFTEQLNVVANVNVVASGYRIEIYDLETQTHLKTLSGDISNGLIETNWNLQDGQGNKIVNGALKCDFFLTSSQLLAQSRGLDVLSKDGPTDSPSASEIYIPVAHINFSSYTIAWGNEIADANRWGDMMLNAVVNNLNTEGDLYGDGTDYKLLPDCAGGNVPKGCAFRWGNDFGNTLTLLQSLGDSGNFFYLGHGTPTSITPKPFLFSKSTNNYELSARCLAKTLGNSVRGHYIAHPFRLVILDACSCYSRAMAHAFGFAFQPEGSRYTVNDYQNGFHRDPQAFVAWDIDLPGPDSLKIQGWIWNKSDPDSVAKYQACLEALQEDWQWGNPISDCMADFAYQLYDKGFWGYQNYKICGCTNLDNTYR